jgi:hypothetical protein
LSVADCAFSIALIALAGYTAGRQKHTVRKLETPVFQAKKEGPPPGDPSPYYVLSL